MFMLRNSWISLGLITVLLLRDSLLPSWPTELLPMAYTFFSLVTIRADFVFAVSTYNTDKSEWKEKRTQQLYIAYHYQIPWPCEYNTWYLVAILWRLANAWGPKDTCCTLFANLHSRISAPFYSISLFVPILCNWWLRLIWQRNQPIATCLFTKREEKEYKFKISYYFHRYSSDYFLILI